MNFKHGGIGFGGECILFSCLFVCVYVCVFSTVSVEVVWISSVPLLSSSFLLRFLPSVPIGDDDQLMSGRPARPMA